MDQDPLQVLSREIDSMLRGGCATLPAWARPEEPGAEAPPGEKAAVRRTILVVEDNADYRALVRSLLSGHSYRVLEAGDGRGALEVLSRQSADLVILDFNMPRMNGYELIQEIRSRMELRRLPIIMFTGAPNRQHLKSLNLDVFDFLEKPVPNSRLLESVSKAFASVPEGEGTTPSMPSAALSPEEAPARVREASPAADPGPQPEPEPPPAIALPSPEASLPSGEAAINWDDESDISVLDERREEPEHGLEELAHDSPLINRVNRILVQAVEMRASDIHIEPGESRVTVRLRVDGALKPLCTLPAGVHPRLVARVKIMSNLAITEKRLPQDGQFRAQIRGAKVEFRVSTLPCTHGEKIVMRILGQSKLKGDLYGLGMTPRDLGCVEKALRCPNGLVLVTGPTGSGKTTSLYTMISVLNRPDVNIMTAEDPVEYELSDISQVKIRPSIGLTFESVLRAFLRQDPDIMLIGEIRDLETAQIAVKASITGHVVFSTLHTNSAPATVLRLTHMGVAPYLVAASVRMVVAQRLVRVLCAECKVPAAVTEDDRRFLTEAEIASLKTIFRPCGCSRCGQTGFAGRKPVFEVMPLDTPAMRQLVIEGRDIDAVQALARSEGMTPLRQAALAAVGGGETSLTEALKIIMGG